jgi:hypothetical protein
MKSHLFLAHVVSRPHAGAVIILGLLLFLIISVVLVYTGSKDGRK